MTLRLTLVAHGATSATRGGAFPHDEPTPGRVKFETMRADMVRNLMAPGNRPVPAKKEGDLGLDLGSASPAGGQ